METVINIKKPTIDSKLLVSLSKSGRNVLAYIIDNHMQDSNVIRLDKLDIAVYIANKIGRSDANTWNVDRGIKDLKKLGVIYPSKSVQGMYIVNLELLSK